MRKTGGYLYFKLKISHITNKFRKIINAYDGLISFHDFYFSVHSDPFLENLMVHNFDMDHSEASVERRVINLRNNKVTRPSFDITAPCCGRKCTIF